MEWRGEGAAEGAARGVAREEREAADPSRSSGESAGDLPEVRSSLGTLLLPHELLSVPLVNSLSEIKFSCALVRLNSFFLQLPHQH